MIDDEQVAQRNEEVKLKKIYAGILRAFMFGNIYSIRPNVDFYGKKQLFI